MMKKFSKGLSFALIFALIVGSLMIFPKTSIEAYGAAAEYSDTAKHWAKTEIDRWSDYGILKGSGGKFRPDDSIKRAEMAAVIDSTMAYSKAAANKFTDLGKAWYTDAVLRANAAGVLQGSGGKVRPEDNISRQEAAVMICKAFGIEPVAGATSFKDDRQIASWAKGYIKALYDRKCIYGVGDNLFSPTAGINRASVVKILDNVVTTLPANKLPAGISGKASDTGKIPAGKRVFVDSAGREVVIPAEINKIAPSGPLAQIVLYTACPDKLSGIASDFPATSKGIIPDKYWKLPKFGQFYGKNVSLNMEALVLASPDVIVDIGEAKATIKKDMDDLQAQLNIPVIFIEASLDTMDSAYIKVGEMVGDSKTKKEVAALSNYCKTTLDKASKATKSLTPASKVKVYFAGGEKGLNTNAKGSFHAEVFDKIGAENVATVEVNSKGAGSTVSMEQVLLWNPQVIVADSEATYKFIMEDKAWSGVQAVKDKKVYQIPSVPYSVMGSPPSVNRIIGVYWLGNLVYPELYKVDMVKELTNFYSTFYHADITQAKAKEILYIK